MLTDVEVDRVLLENGRASAVSARWQGQAKTFKARKEIVLCAGSVGSPSILQRSGIGPRPLLQRLGIGVVHELPGVGGNLQDHLQLRLIYKLENARTLNQIAGSVWGKMGMGLRYLYDRSGPLSMAPSQLGAFARSGPEQTSANLEYHVQPLSLERFGEPLHAFPAFTASVCDLRPQSRGRVDIRSADPQEAPLIQPNYLSHPEDLRVAADAIRLTRRIVAAPALQAFKPVEYLPGAQPAKRRRTARSRRADRHDDFPSGRHLPHGQRRGRGGRCAIARPRHPRPAHRRRLDHAAHHLGQHLFADADDCGESRAADPQPTAQAASPCRSELARESGRHCNIDVD